MMVRRPQMERNEYIQGPLHLLRCAFEIGVLALGEMLDKMDNAMDVWSDYDDRE